MFLVDVFRLYCAFLYIAYYKKSYKNEQSVVLVIVTVLFLFYYMV